MSGIRSNEASDSLPRRAHVCGLGVVRRVPGSAAELEPALRVDRYLDLPQAPCMVML